MQNRYTVRRFEEKDAGAVAALVQKTLVVSNVPDYSLESMEDFASIHTPEYIIRRAQELHFYVVCEDDTVAGCGAIGVDSEHPGESEYFTIFVLPEYQKKGLGKLIIQALEADDYFLNAKRIVIHSSITACDFYLSLGYRYAPGGDILDEEDLYTLEKIR